MHSLRPQQIAYILPGDGYKEADLETILATAQAACSDEKLMELAWEVCANELSVSSALHYVITHSIKLWRTGHNSCRQSRVVLPLANTEWLATSKTSQSAHRYTTHPSSEMPLLICHR